MIDALVAFGSNQGDSQQIYEQTIQRLAAIDGIARLKASKAVLTTPVTGTFEDTKQTSYLNSVFRIATTLDHQQLLDHLLAIEQDLGRIRTKRWDARTVDLDLLIYGATVLETSNLVVPHPRMSFRRFVLEPAVEIAPDIEHPVVNCTLQTLLDYLNHPTPAFAIATESGSAFSSQFDQWMQQTRKKFSKWTPKKKIFETDFFSSLRINPADLSGQTANDLIAPQRLTEHWQDISLLFVVAEIDARNWIRLANRFAGPTLLLRPSLGWSKIETEINAALESAS